jgi:hypothetical protein
MINQIEPRHPIPPPPIHPLAALVTVVLDNIFGVFELVDPLMILFTSVIVGAAGTLGTTLIQRYLAKDAWGKAVAKGLAMGIIAGVPFSVMGTAFGVPLLAWAGLHEWIKITPTRPRPANVDQDIIEGEFKVARLSTNKPPNF